MENIKKYLSQDVGRFELPYVMLQWIVLVNTEQINLLILLKENVSYIQIISVYSYFLEVPYKMEII